MRHLTFHEMPARVYVRPSAAGYRDPTAGHEPVTETGPTPEMLDVLEQMTAGARLVRRTGPSSYVIVK